MSILFSDIYKKSIALFDDPKVTIAYETNKVQFHKLMYTFLQNAISMFTNPVSIGVRLADYYEPVGTMCTFTADGSTKAFVLPWDFDVLDDSVYSYMENGEFVEGSFNPSTRTVTFVNVLAAGLEYAFEQYYVGEFTDDFSDLSSQTSVGNSLIIGEIKDILARLLVKAWAEGERNLLLDIRNLMTDSDFKITGNDKILISKNKWVDQLDSEILQLLNKLSWNIRFMRGSQSIGKG